ncbi:MAG TPA: alpha/beta hydrolase [Acidimicrobiales bacterium]
MPDPSTLDPQVQPIIDLFRAYQESSPSVWDVSPDELRRSYSASNAATPPGPELVTVRDLEVPGAVGKIGARLYCAGDDPAGRPAIVFFHGGGHCIGDLDSHDAVCRHQADRTGATVLSVDYRLAPEHPFPAAHDDAVAATRWVCGHHDSVALLGDSAGGNLVATVALALRADDSSPIAAQAMVYPAVDVRSEHPSVVDNAEGWMLTAEQMRWFAHHYLGADPSPERRADPRVSPLAAGDLSGLPPALIVTAGFDPLRDEGDAYAAALEAAGVEVEHHRFPGMIHTFFNLIGFIDEAERAHALTADFLRRHLGL